MSPLISKKVAKQVTTTCRSEPRKLTRASKAQAAATAFSPTGVASFNSEVPEEPAQMAIKLKKVPYFPQCHKHCRMIWFYRTEAWLKHALGTSIHFVWSMFWRDYLKSKPARYVLGKPCVYWPVHLTRRKLMLSTARLPNIQTCKSSRTS